MMWVSTNNKVLKLLEVLQGVLKNYLDSLKKESVVELFSLFESIKYEGELINDRYGSMMIPIEEPREYPPKHVYDAISAIDYLVKERVSVGAFDSSYFSSEPHLLVPIHIISVGYWYYNYGKGRGGNGVKVSGTFFLGDGIDLELMVKSVEEDAIRGIIGELVEENRFMLFDEAFNLTYTLSWAVEKRRNMAKKVKSNLTICVNEGVIPVAVFHTRSQDLMRGIAVLANRDIKDLPNTSDAMFMRMYLKNVGSRSPLFMIYSKPVRDVNLDLVGFYLKVDTYNVVRVEFPVSFKDRVDMIHSVVFSQAVLGNGFPLAMQRAHDMAVITWDERKIIEEAIAELLRRPSIEYVLSKKELSKRWPIV